MTISLKTIASHLLVRQPPGSVSLSDLTVPMDRRFDTSTAHDRAGEVFKHRQCKFTSRFDAGGPVHKNDNRSVMEQQTRGQRTVRTGSESTSEAVGKHEEKSSEEINREGGERMLPAPSPFLPYTALMNVVSHMPSPPSIMLSSFIVVSLPLSSLTLWSRFGASPQPNHPFNFCNSHNARNRPTLLRLLKSSPTGF